MKKLIPVLIVLLIACQSNTAPETPSLSIEDYFPYDEYTELTYEMTDSEDTLIHTSKITSTIEFKGVIVYVIDQYYYNVVINGEWREYGEEPTEEGEYIVMLKEPLEVGTDLNSYSYIDEVGLVINTDLGTLENCIKVLFPNNGQERYFAPGYGLVKDITPAYTKKLVEVE